MATDVTAEKARASPPAVPTRVTKRGACVRASLRRSPAWHPLVVPPRLVVGSPPRVVSSRASLLSPSICWSARRFGHTRSRRRRHGVRQYEGARRAARGRDRRDAATSGRGQSAPHTRRGERRGAGSGTCDLPGGRRGEGREGEGELGAWAHARAVCLPPLTRALLLLLLLLVGVG